MTASDIPPDVPAAEAARRYHARQLAALRKRQYAIQRGSDDVEDLHKFRVAVRRTRSALDQLRRILPENRVTHFSDEFRWVQNSTGAARDADVYLEHLDDYAAALPARLGAALGPVRGELRRRREAAYEDVQDMLDTPRFEALAADWEAFLDDLAAGTVALPERGESPILAIAKHAVWKAWKRVRKRGDGVDARTPVREIHRLRIACKKLRYLLEMFRPLFGDEELRPLLRPLKRLQDDLGDFNDLEIQQEALRSIASALDGTGDAGGGATSATTEAIAALDAELQRRQQRRLESFAAEFEALVTGPPKARARRLFKRKGAQRETPAAS